MDEYIKRSDVLAMLPDTDTVGYKPSALREKVLALPYMKIGMDTAEEAKDADAEKMEKVHALCSEIVVMVEELVTEGVMDDDKGLETIMKLAEKEVQWLKKNYEYEIGRAFVKKHEKDERPNLSDIIAGIERPQRDQRSDKSRIVYVDRITDKIADRCSELVKAGVWGFAQGLSFAITIADEQCEWMQKNFDGDEVLKTIVDRWEAEEA